MPLYEYECSTHGTFEAIGSLALSSAPAPCPRCEQRSARVLSAPRLAVMARSEVIARDRNERSSHEPRVARKGEGASHMHCRGSCSHGHSTSAKSTLTAYKGARPWVIEHGGGS